MRLPGDRLKFERDTISVMIHMYCLDHHGDNLCAECKLLLDYAYKRIDKCVFGTDKPVCSRCPVHCYKPAMREKIRQVMRYAGPRMSYRYPLRALRYLLYKNEPVPPHPKSN